MNNYWSLSVHMGTMSGWALSSLCRVALDLQSFEDGRCPQEAAEAFVLHLELVYRELLMQEQLDGHSSTITRVCSMSSIAIETRERLKTGANNRCCRAPVVQSGRPRFDIPQGQMIALAENGFTGPQMAEIVGVSLSTIRRRMVPFQLSVSSEYATMSDAELDNIIKESSQPVAISKCWATCVQSAANTCQRIYLESRSRRQHNA